MRLVVPFGMLAVLAVARSAAATPSARLVYARAEEAATCPDETALRKAVAARFGYDPFFGWARQTVVVQISRDGGRYRARVQLLDDQGLSHGTREIASDEDNCSELFDAAALAISIALDASAHTPAPPASAQDLVVQAPAPVAAPAAPESAPAPPDSAPSEVAPVVRTTAPGPLRLGAEALAFAGIGPHLVPGIAVVADFRAHALSVGLELHADVAIPSSVALPVSEPHSGEVESALVAATLAPCVHFGPAFVCVLAEVGRLQAWGWGVSHGVSDAAVFVAAGGRAGVEWPLSERFFFRLHGDAIADLTPPVFWLDHQEAWTAPPVAGTLGAGVVAALP
jgi:hypothetical protein